MVMTVTRVATADHDATVVVGGSGPPMLLIHAIGLDHRMWSGVTEVMAAEATTISYDLRGFGGSVPAPPAGSIAELADDAAAVLEATAAEPAHVVGLSIGGAVAQELALRHPHLVAKLSLCATLCKGQEVARQRAEQAEHDGVGSQVESTLERWFTPAASAEAVAYAEGCLRSLDVPHWAACWRALADLDTKSRLATLDVPAHVIVGNLDSSTPVSVAREIAEAIPGATLGVIDDGPHMLSLETPEQLAREIART